VLSYNVVRRAQEIGVRMALGAEASAVRRMFLWQGTRMTVAGVLIGVVTAVGLTRYVQTLLYGVERLDIASFAGMSAVMLAVAFLASYIPARRASRVDPLVALRGE
jgi:putative ABC transport system permease protein